MHLRTHLSWIFFAATALGAAQPAAAEYLYDVRTSDFGTSTHEQFTEPAILTSLTTVSSFSLNTSTGTSVKSLTFDPLGSSLCLFVGPCLIVKFGPADFDTFTGFPAYAKSGSFKDDCGDATITIGQIAPTPEPSSIILLITVLGGVAFVARKRYGVVGRP